MGIVQGPMNRALSGAKDIFFVVGDAKRQMAVQ
jgi:hypothetical protein